MNTHAHRPSQYCKQLMKNHRVLPRIYEIKINSGDPEGWYFALDDLYLYMVDLLNLSNEKIDHSFNIINFIQTDRFQREEKCEFISCKHLGKAIVCLALLRVEMPDHYRKFISGECRSRVAIMAMHSRMRSTAKECKWAEEIDIDYCMKSVEYQLYRVVRYIDRKPFEKELSNLIHGTVENVEHLIDASDMPSKERAQGFKKYLMCEVDDHGEAGWLDLTKIANIMALAKGS